MSTDDPRVIETAAPVPVPDIAPGEEEASSKTGFQYAEDYGPDSTINNPIHFTFTIYSDGYPLWEDSFSFVTPIGEAAQQPLPLSFRLDQNYPNPFNPKTVIKYELPVTNFVELSIYNLLGQKVATLVNKRQQAGMYQVDWNATGLASGIYYYQIEAGNFVQTRKMIYLK